MNIVSSLNFLLEILLYFAGLQIDTTFLQFLSEKANVGELSKFIFSITCVEFLCSCKVLDILVVVASLFSILVGGDHSHVAEHSLDVPNGDSSRPETNRRCAIEVRSECRTSVRRTSLFSLSSLLRLLSRVLINCKFVSCAFLYEDN